VQAFRAQHPEVQLVLHNVTGKDGLGLLRSDAVDLGRWLDARRAHRPQLRADVLLRPDADHGQGPSARVAGKLRLEDLSPYGLILPPKRLTTWRLVDLVFQQRRVPYTVALESAAGK
jgi:DNA-binding transcriptional LysR family regulator